MAPPFDAFHAYVYATSVWYLTRSFARIYDPYMVYDWFSNERIEEVTSIEIYNLRTDALGLALLSLFVALIPSVYAAAPTLLTTQPKPTTSLVAKIGIVGSMAHHAGTALFAYWQWADVYTSTGAMLLGWTVSCALCVLGVAAVMGVGLPEEKKGIELRSGKKLR